MAGGIHQRHNLALLSALRTRPILTVGDTPSFCESGGIINLELAENRVRLQIKWKPLRYHVQISSKLLSLGATVRDSNPGQELK